MLGLFGLGGASLFAMIGLIVMLAFGRGILPGVSVGDVDLGGLSIEAAEGRLRQNWSSIRLRDADRTWRAELTRLGINIDARRTAELAYAQGRGEGNALVALWGQAQVPPVITVDPNALEAELNALSATIDVAPVNAGVALVDGRAVASPPQDGRRVDVTATILRLLEGPADLLAGGNLELAMRAVQPDVTDSSAIVAQAQALLNNPFDIRVYDPVTGDSVYWSLLPEDWARWLSASPDPASAIGLRLDANADLVRAYLSNQAQAALDASRSVDVEAGVASVRAAIAQGQTDSAYLTVQHQPRRHTVQPGESIISIAWNYGIPYLYIVQANGGQEFVSAGQQITIPPADTFLKLPVVPNKRIVVSISEQRTRVYENGQLIWDWLSSTGIDDSPTWPGVYQVILHEQNAYAGNWNLWMPSFLGVYAPVPGANFTNGFHGFPTRGGGQLLWENSLGRRVTYGCILLSSANARLLYDWAEDGVVVEILP